MRKPIIIFVLLLLHFPLHGKCQSPEIDDFTRFITKNYKFPEELKSNCGWLYAVVRVKTDKHNRVIMYDFVNDPPETMRNFKFLIGYQFSPRMKINQHPIVFYYAADTRDVCTPKPHDLVYNPNDVVNQFMNMVYVIKRADPYTIFVPTPIFDLFYSPIKKK